MVKTDFRTVYQALIARMARRRSDRDPARRPVRGDPPLRRRHPADEVMRRAAYPAAVGHGGPDAWRPASRTPAWAGRHRLFVPPPELPSSLAVDETEYTMRPSQLVVAAGVGDRSTPTTAAWTTTTSRSSTPHGNAHVEPLKPGGSTTITADLAPGTYHVFCSLFAGTPESHEALGMHFELTVR